MMRVRARFDFGCACANASAPRLQAPWLQAPCSPTRVWADAGAADRAAAITPIIAIAIAAGCVPGLEKPPPPPLLRAPPPLRARPAPPPNFPFPPPHFQNPPAPTPRSRPPP